MRRLRIARRRTRLSRLLASTLHSRDQGTVDRQRRSLAIGPAMSHAKGLKTTTQARCRNRSNTHIEVLLTVTNFCSGDMSHLAFPNSPPSQARLWLCLSIRGGGMPRSCVCLTLSSLMVFTLFRVPTFGPDRKTCRLLHVRSTLIRVRRACAHV